jgi:hypothetical protein
MVLGALFLQFLKVKSVIQNLRKCAERYKRAVIKHDTFAMTQISAEYEALVEGFEGRLFLGFDPHRDRRVIDNLRRMKDYELYTRRDDTVLTTEDEKVKLMRELDELIGMLRGLSRSLTSLSQP